DIQKALAESMGLPYESIDPKKLDRRAFEFLATDFMKSRGCCGLRLDEGKLTLGMVDPSDIFLLEEIKRKHSVKGIKVAVVCQSQIGTAIEAGNSANAGGDQFDEIIKDMG